MVRPCTGLCSGLVRFMRNTNTLKTGESYAQKQIENPLLGGTASIGPARNQTLYRTLPSRFDPVEEGMAAPQGAIMTTRDDAEEISPQMDTDKTNTESARRLR